MSRTDYTTTGHKRSEYPQLETVFGQLAYWLSLQFGQYGWVYLGGFEPPYVPNEKSGHITVNGVEYDGTIQVFLDRNGDISLDYGNFHRVGDWRTRPTDAAMRKLESVLMPLARDLFPLPTRENYAAEVFREAASRSYRGASSEVYKMSSDVYRDARYRGYSADIKEGLKLGLERMSKELDTMTFEVSEREY